MLKRSLFIPALLLPFMFGLPAAKADNVTLNLDGGWSAFDFGAVGSSWSDAYNFVISSPAYLTVTDAFLSGDQFSVAFNGVGGFLTSAPGAAGSNIGSDYTAAATNPIWSSLHVFLDAGSYTVTGTTTQSPYGSGGGAIELTSAPVVAVPGPEAGTGLAALAMAGVGAMAYRRKRLAA